MQSNQNEINVGYFELMRFATANDKRLMWLGGIAALVNGMALPMFAKIFGGMTDSFSPDFDIVDQAARNAIYFVAIGALSMLLSFIMFSTWMITGERQGVEYRKNYFKAILNQEIGWFDTINPNELNSKVANEAFAIQGALGEKMPTFIFTFSTCFFGFLIGFLSGWRLALVVSATLPVMSIFTAIFGVLMQKQEQSSQVYLSEAGARAEQSINAIKTIKMLDGEEFECASYEKSLAKALEMTKKYAMSIGIAMGFLFAAILWSYALGFWYGAKLIAEQTINENTGDVYTAGDVMTIFFAILTGGFSLGQAGPCVQYFAKGKAAAVEVFKILDRVPKLLSPVNPQSLNHFDGRVELRNISFGYPKRPEQKILNNINLVIPAGKKVALVGESGCGKSTIMQLIERFYDCEQGDVLFGNVNIKDVDLNDLRSRVGMVGQEPVLFATSIRENLLYGKPDATQAEMIEALTKSHAWDFISKLETGLDTYVGMGGSQLSGGQKQRIAIARAILKKPQLLLLDEATSALDRTNEKLIQATLDEVSKGITTLVIAHRLTTIQNSDLILVIDDGKVIEQGTHQELMNLHGKYEMLAKNQFTAALNEDNSAQEQTSQKELDQDSSQTGQDEQTGFIANAKHSINALSQLEVPSLLKKMSGKNNQSVEIEELLPRQEQSSKGQMMRLFEYNKDERLYFILGLIVALINGCVFPIFSMFLSEMITILIESNPDLYDDDEIKALMEIEVQEKANKLALKFFYCGLVSLVCWALQITSFSTVAENLTIKLRQVTYRKLLRMPISYFDKAENNAGTLTSRLSVDCKLLNGLTSSIIGITIQNIGSLTAGLIIAFYSSWALTLVVLGLAPIVYFAGQLQSKSMQGYSAKTDEGYKDSGNLIMEAVTNIRTVYSFGNQNVILNMYSKKMLTPLQQAQKQGIYAGLAFGFSKSSQFFMNALVFYIGALLVVHRGLSVQDMFTSIMAIMFAVMGAGSNSAFAGDIGAAKNACKNIFNIIDAEDEFQAEERLNPQKVYPPIKGKIEFRNIKFRYGGRDKYIFKDLSLQIQSGTRVSLVGPSGCGKSTIMQLLLRFYEPISGQILVDDIDIKRYDIRHLRRNFAIVSQEPVIFIGTIKENIRYNQELVSETQIIEASKKAHAYDFITANQYDNIGETKGQGFNLEVGPKGGQISGGQKQRIAIARAILRNSPVLLLDEATSALDAQSEQIVLENLNQFVKDKTSITIAHRISTIKDSDLIYVFEDGQIVEQGKYQYLQGLQGVFYRLEHGINK